MEAACHEAHFAFLWGLFPASPPLLLPLSLGCRSRGGGSNDVGFGRGPRPAAEASACSVWRLPSCRTFSLFFFILRLLPSSVGGCYSVREAVGVLNALVMMSKEMRIMVVWQQWSEVRVSARSPSVSTRPFSSCCLLGVERKALGRASVRAGGLCSTGDAASDESRCFQTQGHLLSEKRRRICHWLNFWARLGFLGVDSS